MRNRPALQSLVALLLSGVLGIFMLSIGVKFALRNVLHVETAPAAAMDGGIAHEVPVDWEALYPFVHTDIHVEGVDTVDTKRVRRDPFASYTRRVTALKAVIEAYATDDILLHDRMTEAANRYDRLLGFTIRGVGEYNALVTLEDGYLSAIFPARDMAAIARDIAAFANAQSAAGTPVLYVQAPFKINERDTGVYGVADFTNQNVDALLTDLRAAGVNVFDLRESLAARGGNTHAFFFRTDHHWLPETGLWAAGAVAERLNADCGFAIDTRVFDESNYRFEVYADWFFGSQGKKATLAAAAPEDFTMIYPKRDMRYTLAIPSLGIDRAGGFETLYQMNMLGDRDYYNDNPYSAYFYSDAALKSVHNETIGDGKRLLVLSDSFGNALTPFLCQQIEYVDVIDLRYFTGSLASYIRQNRHDAILLLYSADLFGYPDEDAAAHTVWHDYR